MQDITITPEKVFNFDLKGKEIIIIYNVLLEQPYKHVAPLITKIEQLILEQNKVETK